MQGQNFTGKAYYTTSTNVEKKVKFDGMHLGEEKMKEIYKQLKKSYDKNYILSFNNFESTFEEEKILDKPSVSSAGVRILSSSSNDNVLYKNLKTKNSLTTEDSFG